MPKKLIFCKKNKNQGEIMEKRRIFKKISLCMLSVFIGLLTIMGTACAPVSGNTPPILPEESPPVQEQPSPFGLQPDTDPVVYTTQSGLDIKFGGATLENGMEYGTLTGSVALSGYLYLTMGGTNWVIIGRNPNTGIYGVGAGGVETTQLTLASWLSETASLNKDFQAWVDTYYETRTDAGSAIFGDNISADPVIGEIQIATRIDLSSKEVPNAEIPAGCVLCLSEKNLLTCEYWISEFDYTSSELRDNTESYYNGYLKGEYDDVIQTMSLIQYVVYEDFGGGGIPAPGMPTEDIRTTMTAKLFPLAYGHSDENFAYGTYLKTETSRISYSSGTTTPEDYWLRSTYAYGDFLYCFCMSSTSGAPYDDSRAASHGLRPAFVLSLQ